MITLQENITDCMETMETDDQFKIVCLIETISYHEFAINYPGGVYVKLI